MSARNRAFRFKRTLRWLAVLVVTAAVAAIAVVVVGGFRPGQCSGELALPVTVTSAVEPVARLVAADFQRDHPTMGGRCMRVAITVGNAPEVANELPSDPVMPPALWIPDSTLWAQRAARQAAAAGPSAPVLDIKAPLAITPLVVAAPQKAATALGYPATPLSWQRLVDASGAIAVGDPTTTTEGLATLLVAGALLTNPDGTPRPELTAALLRMSRTALPAINQAFTHAQQQADAPAFTTTEQSVAAFNHATGRRYLVALYPAEGTAALDSPVVRVRRQNEDPGITAAASAFETALRSTTARKYFANAGFRDPHGTAPGNWTDQDGVLPALPKLLPAPAANQVTEALRTWSALTLDTRMLVVIDTSSLMKGRPPGGGTRIQMARDAAGTALAMLPDSSHVGLWTFASNPNGGQSYTPLVPIGPLAEPLQPNTTRRQALQAGSASLPTRVHGTPSLYDTTLAAFRAVRQTYDPKKVNAVVLFVDGHDDGTGTDLNSLLAALRAESDPTQPVLIIPVAFAQDADMAALDQIASTTSAKAYQTKTVGDIRNVLLDAFNQRSCRPHC